MVAAQAVSQWMVERAVLPIENSLGGSIHTVYDLLVRYRLHIVGETSVAVNHCLLALPGTKKQDLVRVMSHPQVRRPWAVRDAGEQPECVGLEGDGVMTNEGSAASKNKSVV